MRALYLAILALAIAATAADARSRHHAMTGKASFYGAEEHGSRTASGQRFNMHAMTAAHRTLPFGTRVKVTAIRSNRSVVVTITDRGPAAWTGRIIDLAQGAARQLHMLVAGVIPVRIEVVEQ